MGLLGSLGKLIGAIFGAIFKFIKKYLAIILIIVIIVCLIYFAPAIAGWLGSVGAPSWLTTTFTWVGQNLTQPLISTLSSCWNGVSSMFSSGYKSFADATIGTKAAIVTGLSAAIAPTETAAVLADAATLASSTVGSIVSGVASSPLGMAVIAGAIWYFFFSDRKKEPEVASSQQQATQPAVPSTPALQAPPIQDNSDVQSS